MLACPDFSKKFVLQTDASNEGLGAALTQASGNGGDKIIAYASRSLSPSEKVHSVTEKECLGHRMGNRKMRSYLKDYEFTVKTDHQSLRWLHGVKNLSGRLANWIMFLQQYNFDIRYRKGVLYLGNHKKIIPKLKN